MQMCLIAPRKPVYVLSASQPWTCRARRRPQGTRRGRRVAAFVNKRFIIPLHKWISAILRLHWWPSCNISTRWPTYMPNLCE